MPYNNNNFQKTSVSTNSFTFFNNESDMLKLSFLDENFSISFNHPVVSMDGKKSYPNDTRKYCVITPSTARSLLYKIDSYWLKDALARYQAQLSGMPVDDAPVTACAIGRAESSILELYYKDITEAGEFRPELRFYEGIDPTTRRPRSIEIYKFDVNKSIKNYDAQTGECEYISEYVQFLIFTETLREYTTVMSRVGAHAAKYVNDFKNREMTRLIREIAQRNGIDTGFQGGSTMPSAPGSYAQARPVAQSTTQDINVLLGDTPF